MLCAAAHPHEMLCAAGHHCTANACCSHHYLCTDHHLELHMACSPSAPSLVGMSSIAARTSLPHTCTCTDQPGSPQSPRPHSRSLHPGYSYMAAPGNQQHGTLQSTKHNITTIISDHSNKLISTQAVLDTHAFAVQGSVGVSLCCGHVHSAVLTEYLTHIDRCQSVTWLVGTVCR